MTLYGGLADIVDPESLMIYGGGAFLNIAS